MVGELALAGAHKAVVFSQWETMLRKAAEVLDRRGIGYALLHGKLTGEERRAAMDRFRTDDSCRVFLSTDAGGTGLNLQTADTVINLEVPWNPAVLEQRIARVHRMGQESPVRAINFVTRDSIEERVVKAVEAKQSLFAGLFDGESDEVNFEALGQGDFLDGMRELIGEQPREQVSEDIEDEEAAEGSGEQANESGSTADPQEKFWRAGVLMLEALAELAESREAVPPACRRQAISALKKALGSLETS